MCVRAHTLERARAQGGRGLGICARTCVRVHVSALVRVCFFVFVRVSVREMATKERKVRVVWCGCSGVSVSVLVFA